jgi:hypothetical protein
MIVLYGEMSSGKSKLALDLVKNNSKSLYLTLDNDFSLIKKLKELKVDYTLMKNCLLMDIKYRVLERGGLLNNDLDFVVIDSLNKISDQKDYEFKIKYLLDVEKDFKIKIISTMNILKNTNSIFKSIDNIEGVRFIPIRKK